MTMTKKALIAGAFLTAASIAGTATAGAPVVYGKANISVNFDDTEAQNTDTIKWNSNASRLGVKGKHKLEGGLQAFYKAEYEVQFDDGTKSVKTVDTAGTTNGSTQQAFTARNVYAGIKGNFGAVKVGRFDTPTKLAIKKVDLFNDHNLGDVKAVLEGENRGNNQLNYSKKIADVKLSVSALAGEETGVNSDNSLADAISASATYKADNLLVALAHDSEVDGKDTAITRLVAQYKMDALKLGVAIQQTDYSKTVDTTGYVLSAAYKVGKNTVKAQFTKEDESKAGANDGDQMMSIGVDHKLHKKVKVYGYYTDYEAKDGVKDANDKNTIGLGFEVKF